MMTFAEIAEREGVSESTVFAQYQSAMRKLRARPETLARLLALVELMKEARRASSSKAA
jgi:DNA-binding NarL/FixJ family response regulator